MMRAEIIDSVSGYISHRKWIWTSTGHGGSTVTHHATATGVRIKDGDGNVLFSDVDQDEAGGA